MIAMKYIVHANGIHFNWYTAMLQARNHQSDNDHLSNVDCWSLPYRKQHQNVILIYICTVLIGLSVSGTAILTAFQTHDSTYLSRLDISVGLNLPSKTLKFLFSI